MGYPGKDWGMVKLTPEQQQMLVAAEPAIFVPVNGTWGHRGDTIIRLPAADAQTMNSALAMAWKNVTAVIAARRQTGWPWLTAESSTPRKVRFNAPRGTSVKPRRS